MSQHSLPPLWHLEVVIPHMLGWGKAHWSYVQQTCLALHCEAVMLHTLTKAVWERNSLIPNNDAHGSTCQNAEPGVQSCGFRASESRHMERLASSGTRTSVLSFALLSVQRSIASKTNTSARARITWWLFYTCITCKRLSFPKSRCFLPKHPTLRGRDPKSSHPHYPPPSAVQRSRLLLTACTGRWTRSPPSLSRLLWPPRCSSSAIPRQNPPQPWRGCRAGQALEQTLPAF